MKQKDLINWILSAIAQDPSFANDGMIAVAYSQTDEFQVQTKEFEAQERAQSTKH